jgi:hypothetical protein
VRFRREPAERPLRREPRWDRRAAALGFAALALSGCTPAQDESPSETTSQYADDPPVTEAECEAMVDPYDETPDDELAVCRSLEDPVVWRSGRPPVPFPPPPGTSDRYYRSR